MKRSAVEQDSFEWSAKNRFSEQTINQAAAVFGWGDEDTNTLKKLILIIRQKFT